MAVSEEILVSAAVQRLRAALPELIAAQDGLPEIAEILDYDPGFLDPTKAPQIWVECESDRRSDAGGRGGTLHKYSHNPVLLVAVTSAGEEPSIAMSRLRQYVGLIRRCMEGDQTLLGNALWVRWMSTNSTPNMSKSGLFKESILTFDVNRRTRIGED